MHEIVEQLEQKRKAAALGGGQRRIDVQHSRCYYVLSAFSDLQCADENLEDAGSVIAPDAFFPVRHGIDAAAQAGIIAAIQPGGSLRDDELIAAADEAGMAMVFTGMRHFRH